MLKYLLTATLGVAASQALAQVQIVESKPIGGASRINNTQANVAAPSLDPSIQNELYFQLQVLQQEVQDLRGLVEEQSYELKRLKQQRLDDYLDLDRRLSQAGQAGTTAPARVSSSEQAVAADTNIDLADTPNVGELASYRSAIDLVLKQRDFDGGAKALQSYLNDFPSGHYVANAQYWLGQIYFQKNDLEQSKKWFGLMIEQFPRHQKAPEAKFKLAKALDSLGEKDKAKELLQEVVRSGSSAAGLAQEYLKQNF